MPRIVEYDPAIARKLDAAIEAIVSGKPRNSSTLKMKAAKGTLKLNFAAVADESKVARHLFDVPDCLYSGQHEAIVAAMPKKGETEPLAQQLHRIREELADVYNQLERSRTYAANLLTNSHLYELEIARLREELVTMSGSSHENALVGSGQLIGLPPPQTRRPPPQSGAFGKGRKRV